MNFWGQNQQNYLWFVAVWGMGYWCHFNDFMLFPLQQQILIKAGKKHIKLNSKFWDEKLVQNSSFTHVFLPFQSYDLFIYLFGHLVFYLFGPLDSVYWTSSLLFEWQRFHKLLPSQKSWVNYQVECLSVSHGLGDGVYDDWQISTHIIHQEQKESDAGSSHLRITHLWEKY